VWTFRRFDRCNLRPSLDRHKSYITNGAFSCKGVNAINNYVLKKVYTDLSFLRLFRIILIHNFINLIHN